MWRDTMRTLRLGPFDARLLGFILLFLVHMAMWTAGLAAGAILAFWLMERRGYVLPIALRKIRSWLAGPDRPAIPWWARRVRVDYFGWGARDPKDRP